MLSAALIACILASSPAGTSWAGWMPVMLSSQKKAEAAETCPWCRNEPELMAALGTLSHGPFPFVRADTEAFAREIPSRWVFLETAHLRFASNLGHENLSAKDRKQLEPELARLGAVLPELPERPKRLDRWLRLHLAALRAEEFYARFQSVLGVTDVDFPEERDYDASFMGDGRFLGEKNKFEIIYHFRRNTHQIFTKASMGVEVTDALRWHYSPEHKLLASVPAEDADLRYDRWLFPHTVHLLSHLFLCAYKHFSYDPPIWLDEGLAHVLEREVNPLSTTIDGDEGSGPHRGGHQDWTDADRRLLRRGKATPFAELMRAKMFHDLELDDHITAWSMVRFLVEEHPAELARFLGGVKGQLDEAGYPSGKDLAGLQRSLLREIWGWTPADFDAAWQSWVRERE